MWAFFTAAVWATLSLGEGGKEALEWRMDPNVVYCAVNVCWPKANIIIIHCYACCVTYRAKQNVSKQVYRIPYPNFRSPSSLIKILLRNHYCKINSNQTTTIKMIKHDTDCCQFQSTLARASYASFSPPSCRSRPVS